MSEDIQSPGNSVDDVESEECSQKNNFEIEYLDTPVKSANDKKDYRTIKLPNGLTALLISDIRSLIPDDQSENDNVSENNEKKTNEEENESEAKEAEEVGNHKVAGSPNSGDVGTAENIHSRKEEKMAACSLCVGVGSFSDPPEIPGLAHFLEHMMFMGSEKYPQENDYSAFITKHGGLYNASTNCEETKFYFEIQEKHLFSALDRLAQFFISPLVKREAITREREAVDSEFQLSVTSDYCRGREIFGSFAQPGHPATRFTCGNLITLRDNVTDDQLYEELHKFRQRHYSAHRMTLAIQARMSLDTLEQFVKDHFSSIPNNGLPPDDFTLYKGMESFDTPAFNRLYKIKPVQDSRQVELTWAMPSMHHLYKSKPYQHVSYIIGYEGKGSLTNYLRDKMWCLNLYCGIGGPGFEHSSMYALFEVTMTLTEDGLAHLKEVLDAVFSYISLMRRSGPQEWIHDEVRRIREITFRFKDEYSAMSHVESLSENMHYYAPSDYIAGNDLYFEYNETEIKACMDLLTPNRVNLILLDKKLDDTEFDKVEPWFNTKYTDTEIPEDWIEHWREVNPFPDFRLPEPNIFITDDFSLVPLPEDVAKSPIKIHGDSMSEIWFRPDPKFKIPESHMCYHFKSPLALTTPENEVLMNLLVSTLNHLLVGELYPANAAALDYVIHTSDEGIIVTVSGFNQKLPLLLSTIMKYIADCPNSVTEDLFNVMKTEILKDYYNELISPHSLAFDIRESILELVHWTAVDKHAALSGVEFYQFQTFAKQFLSHVYVQCLVQGNIRKEDAVKNWQDCVEILNCKPALPNTLPQLRTNEIPLGTQYCRVKNFNRTDRNSMVANYYQSGMGNIKINVIAELIMMIMDEPVFTQLRTQEQLGYNVYCLSEFDKGINSYSVAVCTQADKFTTEYIDERIEAFLKSFLETLEKMPKKEFDSVKVALVKRKQCEDLNLSEEVGKNWAEIISGKFLFDRRDKEIDAIARTDIEEMREWMKNHVLGGNNLRKLSIQIIGKPQQKDEIEIKSGENDENTEESTETGAESCDNGNADSQNISVEYSNDVQFPLEYVADGPNDVEETRFSKNYITDIGSFKKTLYVYPVIDTLK